MKGLLKGDLDGRDAVQGCAHPYVVDGDRR